MINLFVTLHPWIALAFLGILSLLVGSFLNVVIYRLPLMMKEQPQLGLCLPRSHCPDCQTMIPFWHNIPILSYLLLRGHCHRCQHQIDWTYPFVECLCLLLSVFAGYACGFTWTLLFALVCIWFLICLTFIDLKHQLLPDSLTLGLLWVGLLANTDALFTSLPDAVLSAAGAYVGLWLFIQVYYLCTGKIGMGHGDFKLLAALAAWFGWHSLLPILLFSSITGSVIGLIYLTMTAQTRQTPIPFGPFLCVAGLGYLFFTMFKQF